MFGESDFVHDRNDSAVVERRFAVKLAENLMLVGRQRDDVHLVLSVDYGIKHELQSPVVVAYLPRFEVVDNSESKRYIESYLA